MQISSAIHKGPWLRLEIPREQLPDGRLGALPLVKDRTHLLGDGKLHAVPARERHAGVRGRHPLDDHGGGRKRLRQGSPATDAFAQAPVPAVPAHGRGDQVPHSREAGKCLGTGAETLPETRHLDNPAPGIPTASVLS